MRTEDGHIIHKCLNGEPEAFGFLVDKYRESVYAFAYSKLRNFHDAEDVTQEVFFKAYQKLRTLRRWDSFLGWLYSITSNLCKNCTRSRSRRPDGEFMADKDPGTLEIPSIDAYRERLERESLRESLDEALNILPETYRLVLTLHYLGGLSNREIARFLGTSPNAAKQKLMRARAKMKEEMLAMMSETYEAQKLPVGFTFHIAEVVKRMKIQPTPRAAGLPWGLSIATGIIIAILSIGSHLNLPDLIISPMSSARTGEVEMSEVGEMPVEVLRMSRIPISFGKQGNSYGGGPKLPDQQNAVLLAPRGEGDEWPEEPTARLGRGSVKQIAYSPDGKLLAAVGTRGISLYDADSLNEVGILEGHIGDLISVAFSPDGELIAAGTGWELNDSYAVHLWEVQSQKYVWALRGHTDWVRSVVFSPDGKILASGSDDKTVRLWDVEGRKQIGLLQGDADWLSSVAFSPDGKTLASGSWDNTIYLWDVEGKKQVGVLQGHTEGVNSVSFSPDGMTLASGSWDKTVRLWDVEVKKQVGLLQEHTAGVDSVSFSPNGMTLASGGWDNTVRLWDVDKQKQIGMLQGHTDGVWSVAFRPDGKTLASAGDWSDTTIRFWDVQTQEQVDLLQGYTGVLSSVAFSPDSKLLASGGWDSTVRLWDVDTQKYVGALLGHQSWVRSVVFSPDGKLLASSCDDKTIRLWDVDTQKQVGVLQGHAKWRVLSIAFSPDGKLLASGGDDSTILLWDVEAQKQVGSLPHGGGGGEVWSVGFSPDGKTLASGGYLDGATRLWDVDKQKRIGALPEQGVVLSLAFSPDGKTLASGNWRSTVRLWDFGKEKQVGVLQHSSHVGEVAFSPDGKILASGSNDKTLRLWDVKSQKQVCLLREHTSRVSCVAFSPDGKWLVSGSADGTLLLWEVNLDEVGISVEPMGKLPSTWGKAKKTELLQNFPNPFNPETWIPYSLSKSEHVTIRIYTSTGQLVRTLDLGQKPSGSYLTKEKAAYWDGKNEAGEMVASNIYFYVMEAGETTDSRKMVVAR